MIVVTDASPLHYLVLLGEQHLLEQLYGNVVCPQTVLDECAHLHAPEKLRLWAAKPPAWLHVVRDSPSQLSGLDHLDPGEKAAIETARTLGASILLMDEKKGRLAAEAHGFVVVGVLGILVTAAKRGLVDFEEVMPRLTQQTNFRISEALIQYARTTLRNPIT
jgi:predicted nucleic acid-binding protein